MATEVYSLQIHGMNFFQDVENVLSFIGVGLTADDTFFNSQNLIESFEQDAMAKWLGVLPGNYNLMRLVARRISIPTSKTYHKQFQPSAQPGSLGTSAQSLNLCPVIRLIPPMGTKSGGKIFLPCIGNAQIDKNVYAAGYVTAVTTLMTQLMTTGIATTGITWKLAIHSRKLNIFSSVIGWTLGRALGWQGNRRKVV